MAPRKIGDVGLLSVGVSIDGPPEINDGIRGLRRGFERSTAFVKTLAAVRGRAGKKYPLIHMTAVIQEGNIGSLAELPPVARALGADVLNLTMESRKLDLAGIGQLDPAEYSAEAIRFPKIEPQRVLQMLRTVRIAARDVGLELRTPDMPDEVIAAYYDGRMDLRRFRCSGIWSNLIVSTDGGVYPCWLTRVGNARQSRLRTIWNGPEFRGFRRRIRRGLVRPCVGCCFLEYCGPTRSLRLTWN